MKNNLRRESYQDQLSRLFKVPSVEKGAKSITFQVTEDCNLACTYCYQTNKTKNKMTFDIAKRFIDELLSNDVRIKDYIDSYSSAGVILEFIGGEPFLEIELIDKITDYFISETIRLNHPWATRYMISICSNGILYFDPRVQNYIKKNFRHLSFSISIDGNKELHDSCRIFSNGEGSYDIAIKGVKHFKEVLGGDMGSKMTIAPENISYLSDAVISLIENDYDDIHLNCVYENVWKLEHSTELYFQLKTLANYLIENDLVDKIKVSMFDNFIGHTSRDDQNYCGGTGLMLAIDYKGDFYPCLRYMESSLNNEQEPYTIGNIECGIGKTCSDSCKLNCLKSIKMSTQSSQKCIDCPISTGCGWCSAYNYQIYGTPNKRATFICDMHQARVLANSYLWNKWYKKIGSQERYQLNIPESWAINIISKEEFLRLKEDSL